MVDGAEIKLGSGLGWRVFHDTLYVGGKKGAEFVGGLIGGGSHGTTSVASGALGGFAGLGPIIAVAGIAAVSAGTAVMDYFHEKREMLDLYREEIAAKLGKKVSQVTEKDLKILASGDVLAGVQSNHTIAEGLRDIEDKRDLNIVTSVVSSLGSYGLVHLAHGAITSAAAAVAAATAIPAVVSTFVMAGALGLVAYYALRAPMRGLANAIYGMDKKPAHEKIVELERGHEAGKQISREQVFSVFVSANERLQDMIQQQTGKDYDALPIATRNQLADHFAGLMDIDRFVGDLNSGRINVSELAFAVEGQRSGVLPKDMMLSAAPQKSGMIKTLMDRIGSIFTKKEHVHVQSQQTTPRHSRVIIEYDNPVPEVSFVERLGRTPVRRQTHVEHVVESREQAALLPQQQQA